MDRYFETDHRIGGLTDRFHPIVFDYVAGLGAGARCAGPTAAALHDFDGYLLRPPFHFVTPRPTNRRRIGHQIHTSTVLPSIDCEEVKGISVTSPTRTIIDLAVTETPVRLTAALDGALRDHKTTETFLLERISALRGKGRYGIPKLLDVIEGAEPSRGGHSFPERRFLELVAAAGLPRPLAQTVLSHVGKRQVRVDMYFPGTPIVVEVMGFRWHRTALQLQQDSVRLNRLQIDGYVVLQFTYWDIVDRPGDVVRHVSEALTLGRAA